MGADVAFGVGAVVVNLGVEAAGVTFGVGVGIPDCLIKLSRAAALLFLFVLVHGVLYKLQYPLLNNVML